MTKKEKETMNLLTWKVARRYLRAEEKGRSEEELKGMFTMISMMENTLGIDINAVMAEIKKGKTYEEMFGDN